MAINKPNKPTSELPEDFGGIQTPYTQAQIENGYMDGVPQVVDGGNINYENKGLFQANKYMRTIVDFIRDMPIGSVVTVNDSNKLDYTTISDNRNIGQIIQSTLPLSDASLHLLDGALIQGDGVYSDFVQYISGLVNDHPNLFTNELAWQTSVTNYGVCGKYVYDATNNTVRLPLITGFIEGTNGINYLGNLTTAGLPNITGYLSTGFRQAQSAHGAFSVAEPKDNRSMPTGSDTYQSGWGWNFSAQASSSIYGNSSTVQPQSIKVLYYVVLAISKKTNIEVDIDNIVTDLNNKVSKTDTETIGGTKTFTVSPQVPTSSIGDSSFNAANTAFVTSAINSMLSSLYPVGSIYIGTQSSCPLSSLISGSTWELVAANRALWGGNGTNANTTIAAGLPNITGSVGDIKKSGTNNEHLGALTYTRTYKSQIYYTGTDNGSLGTLSINAADSNSIYGASTTVQPPAYVVNIWRRTA